MKESYRHIEHRLPAGWDFIFIARNTILNQKCADVKKSMEIALKRVGVLR